jgi:hypothetical protein
MRDNLLEKPSFAARITLHRKPYNCQLFSEFGQVRVAKTYSHVREVMMKYSHKHLILLVLALDLFPENARLGFGP